MVKKHFKFEELEIHFHLGCPRMGFKKSFEIFRNINTRCSEKSLCKLFCPWKEFDN